MKLTLKNLSMAIMMSGMIMGSSAMAADMQPQQLLRQTFREDSTIQR